MTNPTAEFFDKLGRRGHESRLAKVGGTVRFDVEHDQQIDHWFLAISKGDISVSREEGEADAVIHAERASFDRVVTGESKPLAAWLRNEISVEGKFQFLVLLDRLLPGAPGARDPRALAREGRRRS